MRPLTLLLTLVTVLRTLRGRSVRGSAQPIPAAPSADSDATAAQLERLAACWAASHRGAPATS